MEAIVITDHFLEGAETLGSTVGCDEGGGKVFGTDVGLYGVSVTVVF